MIEIFIAMAAAALASSPAAAKDILVVSTPQERVGFADLDLRSDAGARKLEARIRRAARNLCIEDSVLPLSVQQKQRACFNEAVADGLLQASRVIEAQKAQSTLATSGILVRTK